MTQEDGQRNERESSEPKARGGSLRDVFPGYFRPTDEEFDSLWDEGMFVVDTNVLLNLYRYSPSTRGELLAVLQALTDRLFLPHQVGLEFLERRLTTIQKQRRGFAKLRKTVTGFHEHVERELRNVLRLRSGEALPPELQESLEKDSPNGYANFAEQIKRLEEGLPTTSNTPDTDEVWAAVEALFEGKVGPAYGEEERQEAVKEAEHRREAQVPPGFKDERPGDYLLWRQTIDEARCSGRPVVLVTDDRKEDWWWIEEGETLGARRQLVVEMREEARVLFHMYTPDRLMEQARERLGVKVSDQSISEAEGFGQEADDEVRAELEVRPRNWLVPVILLILREWDSYGYELMERTAAFGFEAMNPGTLYRTLRLMEAEGLVESWWDTSKGEPARRMYSITDAGKAYLDFWVEALEQYRPNMETFFELYEGRGIKPSEPRPEIDPDPPPR